MKAFFPKIVKYLRNNIFCYFLIIYKTDGVTAQGRVVGPEKQFVTRRRIFLESLSDKKFTILLPVMILNPDNLANRQLLLSMFIQRIVKQFQVHKPEFNCPYI